MVAERLRAKGLLLRRQAAADKRRAELSVSPAGQALLKRSPNPLQNRLLRSLQGLPQRPGATRLGEGFGPRLVKDA